MIKAIKRLRDKVNRKILKKMGVQSQSEKWAEFGNEMTESFAKGIRNGKSFHKELNCYFWRDHEGNTGNQIAESEEKAIQNVKSLYGLDVKEIIMTVQGVKPPGSNLKK